MSSTSSVSQDREAAAKKWLAGIPGYAGLALEPASSDASFRQYFRLKRANDSVILMDAPPEREDCRPFIHVADLLGKAGLNAPTIIAQNLEQGFLLLSDLGTQTYLHVINEHNADALFSDAIEALIRWQLASRPNELPSYDDALLRRELSLFPDWYIARHLRLTLSDHQREMLCGIEDLLVESALAQPSVYVHRDFMPRNLMISTPNPGVLDFQDAVYGPITYDVASLFKDAFLSWPELRVQAWTRQYWERAHAAGLPLGKDFARFYRDFEWMGMQRHLKVLGIFARINYRDGKPGYLADTPRFLRYVSDTAGRYEELAPMLQLLRQLTPHIPVA